jgi:hypothetical protein
MNNKKEESEKAISVQKAKVKISEYPENMFINGVFNPITPQGYNFLTGRTEDSIPPNHGLKEYVLAKRVNGMSIFRN